MVYLLLFEHICALSSGKKPIVGVEPTTFYLQGKCSTTKLYRRRYSPALLAPFIQYLHKLIIFISFELPILAMVQFLKVNAIAVTHIAQIRKASVNVSDVCKFVSVLFYFL